jgi:hypothetical protein
MIYSIVNAKNMMESDYAQKYPEIQIRKFIQLFDSEFYIKFGDKCKKQTLDVYYHDLKEIVNKINQVYRKIDKYEKPFVNIIGLRKLNEDLSKIFKITFYFEFKYLGLIYTKNIQFQFSTVESDLFIFTSMVV